MAGDVYRALADETRRDLIEALAVRPMAVHELAARHAISRPAISRHLRVMMDAGLVQARKAGKENVYHLNAAPLEEVRAWLDQFWRSRIGRLKKLSEADER